MRLSELGEQHEQDEEDEDCDDGVGDELVGDEAPAHGLEGLDALVDVGVCLEERLAGVLERLALRTQVRHDLGPDALRLGGDARGVAEPLSCAVQHVVALQQLLALLLCHVGVGTGHSSGAAARTAAEEGVPVAGVHKLLQGRAHLVSDLLAVPT